MSQHYLSDFEISELPELKKNKVPLKGLTSNSKEVEPGFLYAAFAGSKLNGAAFVDDAIEKGAVAILIDRNETISEQEEVHYLRHSNPRAAFCEFLQQWYQPKPTNIVSITGTNGKTSVAHFYQQIVEKLGKHSAYIGTIGLRASTDLGDKIRSKIKLTTPDSNTLHSVLHDLAGQGVHYVSVEASSHGLSQYRLDGIEFQAAAFTNFTRDHLDYHKTEEDYFKAKLRLFDSLLPSGKMAVLNSDIPEYGRLEECCNSRKIRVLDFGETAKKLKYEITGYDAKGVAFTMRYRGGTYPIKTKILGAFQVSNLVCAVGLVIACGIGIDKIAKVLSRVTAPPGRLECISRSPKGATMVVDYAHTPDALKNALQALRPITKKALWVVFGCGGDRDTGKRPQMGAIAHELADHVIITDDNPRSEDPIAIREAIIAGADGDIDADIDDRSEAIAYAMQHAKKGDVVLVAGKGHENYQAIGETMLHFSDKEEILNFKPEQIG